jgi:cell volume regulation protein A
MGHADRMMEDIEPFGLVLLIASLAVSLALLSNRVSQHLRIPAPAIFLIAAAVVSDLIPELRTLPLGVVEQIVTVALIVILFDGGMHIGLRRIKVAAGPVLSIGVLGTFLTTGAIALIAHGLFGLSWTVALLLGTALAPTDPAVVFSVLGNREISGRAGTIIEGESGANDPVGIALLLALVAAGGETGGGAVWRVLGEFAVQMAVGAFVGLIGGRGLLWVMQRVSLPSEGLYPIRTLAISVGLYGLATVTHGSGFLAVFLAGIVIGDASAPFKREIERFHSSLASLAEIIAFVVLGLTVSVTGVITSGALLIGLAIAALLALVVRPLLVGPLLLATGLRNGERIFVLWAGLKGAVPILLGTYILAGGTAADTTAYEIIFVVVAFSVILQGGLVPTVARWCGVRMRVVETRPWTLGVRLRDEPEGARSHQILPGAPADGRSVRDLHLGKDIWISLIVRDGRALAVRADTELRAGDEVLLLAPHHTAEHVENLFRTRTASS